MCLWTTSSEDKNGPFRCAESKASKTEGQYGWTSSRAKKHYQRRWKCREVTQEEYKGTAQAWTDAVRKVELSWNWNKLGRGRSARRVSVGTYIYIGSWGKWRPTIKWSRKISDERCRKGPGTQWLILLSFHWPGLLSGVLFCGSEAVAHRAESSTPSFKEGN